MKRAFSYFVIIMFLGNSCTTVRKGYFTPNVKKILEYKGIPLDKIQFYVDRKFELKREKAILETEVKSGKLEMKDGKNINIITLRKSTPGICTKVLGDTVYISFEFGDNRELKFCPTKSKNNLEPYELDYNVINNETFIKYDEKLYYFSSDRDIKLMIKRADIEKYIVEKREMKGRQL